MSRIALLKQKQKEFQDAIKGYKSSIEDRISLDLLAKRSINKDYLLNILTKLRNYIYNDFLALSRAEHSTFSSVMNEYALTLAGAIQIGSGEKKEYLARLNALTLPHINNFSSGSRVPKNDLSEMSHFLSEVREVYNTDLIPTNNSTAKERLTILFKNINTLLLNYNWLFNGVAERRKMDEELEKNIESISKNLNYCIEELAKINKELAELEAAEQALLLQRRIDTMHQAVAHSDDHYLRAKAAITGISPENQKKKIEVEIDAFFPNPPLLQLQSMLLSGYLRTLAQELLSKYPIQQEQIERLPLRTEEEQRRVARIVRKTMLYTFKKLDGNGSQNPHNPDQDQGQGQSRAYSPPKQQFK